MTNQGQENADLEDYTKAIYKERLGFSSETHATKASSVCWSSQALIENCFFGINFVFTAFILLRLLQIAQFHRLVASNLYSCLQQ
jgi:hypothetical protein